MTSSGSIDHAPFDDITSEKGDCVVGNPNTFISIDDVDDQWNRRMSKYVPTFENLIFDQIVHSNGSLSYCVRWDSTEKLSKSAASKFVAIIAGQYKLWNHYLIGMTAGLLTRSTVGDTIIGAGGDWGQRVEFKGKLATIDEEQMMVLAHEIGHAFGLPDFYEVSDKSATFPAGIMHQSNTFTDADGWMLRRVLENTFLASIMDQSNTFTDADGWMLRRVLEDIKSRYDF